MEQVDIVIVGAGFSGLGMAIQLARHGRRDFALVEKSPDLGGTWFENRYPGCACDVPSPLYSYSFAPNPRWSRVFAPRDEIWQYLDRCAERYALRPHLRLGRSVTGARFDETSERWRVELDGEPALDCRVLVMGVGALHQPRIPDIEGLTDFGGEVFHSSHWPEGFTSAGKRVAVIGTGASAIQTVPVLAHDVAHLDVFQRTPAWIMPRPDVAMPDSAQRLFERVPVAQSAVRGLIYGMLEVRGALFRLSRRSGSLLASMARRHLAHQVRDPELRERLTPRYQIGCKRILISSDFYPALQRPNVSLVTDRIARLTADGIQTEDGTVHPADAVVLATGFDVRDNMRRVRVTGRAGQSLDERWSREGVNAHLGMTVSGFPNLFVLLGPNTGLGHTSVVLMIEAQVRYVLRALRELDASGAAVWEVDSAAQQRSVQDVQRRLAGSVWDSGCLSWYLDENGRNFTMWPGSTLDYFRVTARRRPKDHRVSGDPVGQGTAR